MAEKAQWNYEDCIAERGSVICGKALRPTWWCANIRGARIKCVRVTYGDQVFFLKDDDGTGSRKVFELGGGPDSYHASIPVDDKSSFRPDPTEQGGTK